MLSLALSDEAIPLALFWQEKTVEKKKKRAVGKKLGHYLFAHSKATSQNWAEASRALEEARAEVKKARVEADILKVASETHGLIDALLHDEMPATIEMKD
ncbi:hypothetical protein COCNU_scaffold007151G000020 [Cocos nucifera]|nr:hypothetical protein [Cocos nucifera]